MSYITCGYCGNNPVPHKFYWYNESLNILLTPIRQRILYNGFTRFFKKNNWGNRLSLFFLELGEWLLIIQRQSDVTKCKVRRAQVLWEEALKRGINMQEILVFGKSVDVYVAQKKVANTNSVIIFSGLPRPSGYLNKWLDLMDDKWLLKQEFKKTQLPVPEGAAVCTFSEAKSIFNKIQKPVIVKPRAGSRGRHSTTFIYTLDELRKAYKIAKQLCFWVMVEEQISGPIYRATVINFELAGVLRGDAPNVIGDGMKTIAELISVKNKKKSSGVKEIVVDNAVENFLSRQNLKLTSVLMANRPVYLTEKIGVNYGGSSSEDFEICHPDNKELFVSASKVLGDPIVGFDFIIPDITKSYKVQKCGFIEVNSLPFINLHHDPLLGKPQNVAGKVWKTINW